MSNHRDEAEQFFHFCAPPDDSTEAARFPGMPPPRLGGPQIFNRLHESDESPVFIAQCGCGQPHGYLLPVAVDHVALDADERIFPLGRAQGAVGPAKIRAEHVPAGYAPDVVSHEPG